jgi:hypothetical protein
VFETYRMLGKQRETELLREARRLQVGVSTRRPRRAVQRAFLPTFRPTVLKSSAGSILGRLVAKLGATGSNVEDRRGGRAQRARTSR